MNAQSIQESLARNGNSLKEILDHYIKRINKYNSKLNALTYVAFKDTPSILESVDSKKNGKLYGVPIAIKDNICVKGWEITCSSRILKGFVSPYSATVIEKLVAEGAILIGRANMDEFAFGSSCETSCYGPTRNPWNPDHVPGGSSGGSVTAVSADLACMALGSDTGGSIRQPASFCGVVGLKPTYGRVSRYGLVAFGSSLDQIGPITNCVKDAAVLLGVIAGFDSKDSTSANREVPDYAQEAGKSIKGLRIGIPKEFFVDNMDPDVKSQIQASIDILSREGAECVDVSLPHTEYAVPTYYVIAPSEASSNLARFDGVRYGSRGDETDLLSMYLSTRRKGFGPEAKRRIMLGTYALSSGYYDAFYLKAMKVRKKIIEDFEACFNKVDCLVTPTSPTGAFRLGEKIDDPWSMYLSDMFTISANLAGIPAISVPSGMAKGMPVGLQIMSKPFDEGLLFRVGQVVESKRNNKSHRPKLD